MTLAATGGGPARFKDGPPPAHTGGFGEPTCRQCHSDAGLNEAGGELELRGVPPRYQPRGAYDLAVWLRRAGMRRAGFELAVRFAGGAQAGGLEPADSRSQVVMDSARGVWYLEHTLAGTVVAGDSSRWLFRWTAPPDARGAVVFHVAANAANDDDSPLGDFIYARAVEVPPARR